MDDHSMESHGSQREKSKEHHDLKLEAPKTNEAADVVMLAN
jgi:hypothetical protein